MNILQYSTHFYYVKIAGYVFTFYLVSPEQPTQRKHARENMAGAATRATRPSCLNLHWFSPFPEKRKESRSKK
jgi:hypothetical protein